MVCFVFFCFGLFGIFVLGCGFLYLLLLFAFVFSFILLFFPLFLVFLCLSLTHPILFHVELFPCYTGAVSGLHHREAGATRQEHCRKVKQKDGLALFHLATLPHKEKNTPPDET